MTVDEYLAWAEHHPRRYELHEGEVCKAQPETAGHAETKAATYVALFKGITARKLPFNVLPSGVTIRIDDTTAYEPDAVVYSGERIARSAVEVPSPLIVVEVLSSSTRQVDVSIKLAGYFRLPSIVHYLIVDPSEPMIVHHARGAGGDIITRVMTEGALVLDPPGLEIAVEDIYAD